MTPSHRLDLLDPDRWSAESSLGNLVGIIDDVPAGVETISAKRLVIDSIPGICLFTNPENMRMMLMRINTFLRNLECTTLMTTETVEASISLSRFGVEEFLATGIVYLAPGSKYNELKRSGHTKDEGRQAQHEGI